MTSRERILKTFEHEKTDRMPWTPLIDGYYLSGLPEKKDVITALREINADIIARHINVHKPVAAGNLEITHEEIDGNITERIITPHGELTAKWIRTEISPFIPFPTEHRLKSIKDLKAYRFYIENREYETFFDTFNEIDREIGDDGIATPTAPGTPLHYLLMEFGVEEFYYHLNDYPNEINELYEVFHEKNKQLCRLIAKSNADVVINYENTSTTTMSPAIYERYCQRQLDDYAEIFRAAGKKFLTHMCGTLNGLKNQLAKGRMDGIIDIAPYPTGDVALHEAKKYWGHDKIVMGGIDATAFRNYSVLEMKTCITGILNELNGCTGVFLGTGDAMPQGAKIENLLEIARMVKQTPCCKG